MISEQKFRFKNERKSLEKIFTEVKHYDFAAFQFDDIWLLSYLYLRNIKNVLAGGIRVVLFLHFHFPFFLWPQSFFFFEVLHGTGRRGKR